MSSPGGPFDLPPPAEATWAPARLPVGRHGLPREFVQANQRGRLMAAALEVFTTRGYTAGSVADLVKVAGVSRHTFYDFFDDKEDCFLGTYDAIVDWLTALALGSDDEVDDWGRRVIAVVRSLVAALADDPRLVRFLAVEALGLGAEGRARCDALIDRVGAALRSGRGAIPDDLTRPQEVDSVLAAGAISVLARRSERGGTDAEVLAAELGEIILAPYLGLEAARELAGGSA